MNARQQDTELTELGTELATQIGAAALENVAKPDPFEALALLLEHPPQVPKIGEHASRGMKEAFERVAQEIVQVAEDSVRRANENLQEATSYAEVIRQSGDILCDRIEAEAVRMLQISRVMREARAAFAGPITPEGD